jgi:methionyl-tRNA formyltransferase
LPVAVSGAPPTLADVARGRGVPVCYWPRVGEPPPELGDAGADLYLVAGFPFRLPVEVLGRAHLGGLNLHPSLLPCYRGPAPLFWQLRAGEGETGVTLHRMSDRLDAGAVLAQSPVPLPDGAGGAELARTLGDAAADLFLDRLARLREATLEDRPQDESRATYQPWPRAEDFVLSTDWTARRAFNFLRGTEAWGYPYTVRGEGRNWRVRTALAWWAGDGRGADPAPKAARCVRLRFSPGLVDVLTV